MRLLQERKVRAKLRHLRLLRLINEGANPPTVYEILTGVCLVSAPIRIQTEVCKSKPCVLLPSEISNEL